MLPERMLESSMGWMGVRGPWSLLPADGKLPTEVLSALRMGLLVERGLGETKEPPGVPFLRGVSWP